MYKYLKLKDNVNPAGCSEIMENGQKFVVSDTPLDLALLFLFDLEPVDQSGLSDNDRLALDDWYSEREIKRWWRDGSYEEQLFNKSPLEVEKDLYGNLDDKLS